MDNNGIHPAPAAFTAAQIATDPILHFFHYAHLPAALQAASKPFCALALHIIETAARNPERSVALRKLLEAKDAAVRAMLPAPKLENREPAKPGLGEPVETGGHSEDQDGPVDFGS